jgi:hypothetical protein
MIPRLLLLLLLLLLPAFASAQPTHWSVAASTCVPDESSVALYSVDEGRLSFRPGTAAPVFGPPLLVRCPIHPPGAAPPRWTLLLPVWVDPDGDAAGARIDVRLKRQASGHHAEWIAGSQSDHSPPGSFIAAPWDFTLYTYWIELRLWRRTPTTPAPRVFQVWLQEGLW